jgi:hypothetical protein
MSASAATAAATCPMRRPRSDLFAKLERLEDFALKFLSTEETLSWCKEHDIALRSDFCLPERSDTSAEFKIPEDAQKRVALASRLMTGFAGTTHVLVWFDDWSVWQSGQRMHIFERFRMSYGETRPLIQCPGHVFDKDELDDAISFVTLAVLFLWDCYVVIPKREKLLFFSHDEYGLLKGIDSSLASVKPAYGSG